jgi:pimeloyl-ACP methyl ester carboxylesterase
VPILVIRGAESDLLPADLASEMLRRNPRATVVDIEGCGHAPPLTRPEQIGHVSEFLEA